MTRNAGKIVEFEIDRLIPYENNARIHSEQQIEKIRASIKEFGFINPIIVDKDFGVIAGHGRLEAAKLEGMTKAPCLVVEHLSESQKKAYILADNRLAEMSAWDMVLVKSELDCLDMEDFDIDIIGFDIEPIDPIVMDDNIQPLPKTGKCISCPKCGFEFEE